MRTARDFVEDYRRKGYPDDRIRIVASMRPEPLRSEALRILDGESKQQKPVEESPPDVKASEPNIPEVPAKIAAQGAEVVATVDAEDDLPSPRDDVESLRKEVTSLRKERDRVGSALKRAEAQIKKLREQNAKSESLRKRLTEEADKERGQINAELAGAKSEIEKLRAESSKSDELRKQAAEADAVRKALSEANTRHKRLLSEKADLEARITQVEATLEQRDKLLAEKGRLVIEVQSTLARERTEREAAVSRVVEVESLLEEKSERLRGLESKSGELEEAHALLEELRGDAAQLKDDLEADSAKIGDLEGDMEQSRGEAATLKKQIDANEQALADLKEKLNGRESELEALREHFDREAADLKRRAEQEVWMIQTRLRRMRKLATVGTAVAVCLLLFTFIGYVSRGRRVSELLAAQGGETTPSVRRDDVAPVRAETPRDDVVTRDESSTSTGYEDALGLQDVVIKRRQPAPAPMPQPEDLAPKPPPAPQYRIHTVEKGDSLWGISKKYFGTGSHSKSVAELNGIDLDTVLHIGMKLRVPVDEPR